MAMGTGCAWPLVPMIEVGKLKAVWRPGGAAPRSDRGPPALTGGRLPGSPPAAPPGPSPRAMGTGCTWPLAPMIEVGKLKAVWHSGGASPRSDRGPAGTDGRSPSRIAPGCTHGDGHRLHLATGADDRGRQAQGRVAFGWSCAAVGSRPAGTDGRSPSRIAPGCTWWSGTAVGSEAPGRWAPPGPPSRVGRLAHAGQGIASQNRLRASHRSPSRTTTEFSRCTRPPARTRLTWNDRFRLWH